MKENDKIPYEHCLNCGTELQGMFCHKCGQQATSKTPKIKDFILEYINNAFNWDALFLKTIANLVRRPGYLTNEYNSGKFISQEHPLKLNMFLLLLFVSLFLFFSGSKSADLSSGNISKSSVFYPVVQLGLLTKDDSFVQRMNESSRDTVMLFAPLSLAEAFPNVIETVSVVENTNGKGIDKFAAVMPRIFIEEGIIVPSNDGCYIFNNEESLVVEGLAEFKSVWEKLANFVTTYFPMLMLFTAPLLALAVAFIQRKSRRPFIQHFIFSLHYTALLELLIITIYLLHLIATPSMEVLQWIVRICAILYLTLAFRLVYEPNSWFKAITKALFTYLIYLMNCLLIFIAIVVITCFVVVFMAA